jgi:hypothetical protein
MAAVVVVVFALIACGSPSGDGAAVSAVAPKEQPVFRSCTGRLYTPALDEKWRHRRSAVVAALGDANHAGVDLVATPGVEGKLAAKFAYGPASKDLEDEDVLVSIDDCASWKVHARSRTDHDGRIAVAAPELAPGVYEVRFQVVGDRTVTASFLWVLPRGTRIVVTDIDATLTTSDAALWRQLREGMAEETTYPNAAELVRAHQAKGHIVVYLTGRPYMLQAHTRRYLAAVGFGAGVVRVTDSTRDVLPTADSVGAYKLANLKALLAAGLEIDFAYGNATTDIAAYLGAGIPADRVWIIGKHGGKRGTRAITGDWGARVREVAALPAVAQPFAR